MLSMLTVALVAASDAALDVFARKSSTARRDRVRGARAVVDSSARILVPARCVQGSHSRYVRPASSTLEANPFAGYRIRELTALEESEKVRDEVRRMREGEKGLVKNYRLYLKTLETEIKRESAGRLGGWS